MPRRKDSGPQSTTLHPSVRRDEARALALYEFVRRCGGWPAIRATDGRGRWVAACYVGGRLTPAYKKAGAQRTHSPRVTSVMFVADAAGELLEPRVILATQALEYVTLRSRGRGISSAFKALARVGYRLNEAHRIGVERASRKARTELDRIEAAAIATKERLDLEVRSTSEDVPREESPLPHIEPAPHSSELMAKAEMRWLQLVGHPHLTSEAERQRAREVDQVNAELWLISKIRKAFEEDTLVGARGTIRRWFKIFGSGRHSSPAVLLDAMLRAPSSPCCAPDWSRSSAARLWHRAHHAPDAKKERELSRLLYAAQDTGKPLDQDAGEWWNVRSISI